MVDRIPPKASLTEELQNLIASPIALTNAFEELELYSQVDAAHLTMLRQKGVIPTDVARALAVALQQLISECFLTLEGKNAARGLFIAYQEEIGRRLEKDWIGFLHMGRSRNDLNATVLVLRLRKRLTETLNAIDSLRSSLIDTAIRLDDAFLPVFSQYQIAGPGQAWHYFASIEASVAQLRRSFLPALEALQTCPLGAGAGAGTSLPIDTAYTADLLGFEQPVDLSLKSVAGRESALLFNSALGTMGTVLGRMAQDFQVWLLPGLHFGDLPDNLSGTSSMLPHKRNPYLLEHVKSLSVQVTACVAEYLSVCAKVPFCNSVEISGFIPEIIGRQSALFLKMFKLTQSIVDSITINEKQSSVFQAPIHASQVIAEQEALRFRSSFGERHESFANCLRSEDLTEINKRMFALDCDCSPRALSALLRYGGGPGTVEKSSLLQEARRRLSEDEAVFLQSSQLWSQAFRNRDQLLSALAEGN